MRSVESVSLPLQAYDTRRSVERVAPDGPLDQEDMARLMTGFRGQPIAVTPSMRYVRAEADGNGTAYVFDAESGMVYILD